MKLKLKKEVRVMGRGGCTMGGCWERLQTQGGQDRVVAQGTA